MTIHNRNNMNTKIKFIILGAALCLPLSMVAKPKSLEDKALETMKTATRYMMDKVSYNGGSVV